MPEGTTLAESIAITTFLASTMVLSPASVKSPLPFMSRCK